MNGQFPIGTISPWRYFASIGFFLACLLSISDDDNVLPYWLNFVVWQVQVFSCLSFFIATHNLMKGVLARQNDLIKLTINSVIAVTVYVPFSLLRDVYIEQETAYTLYALFEEWQNMAPVALISWVAINLPWLSGFQIKRTENTTPSSKETLQTFDSIANKNKNVTIEPVSINSESAEPTVEPQDNSATQPENDFLKIAKIDNIDSLICLKAELHYLKVVTEQEQHLILYNLKDAIEALSDIGPKLGEGQTHRSYWVNPNHAEKLLRKNREGELVLSNQDKVPVSRTNMKKVKGWFE
ncbi:LytTR family DNA-binding domain-containing protein [Pseudoalteromonas phenolica]|uniref:LytTR family DNA-binding domain-containing protein n=1 Tax=Pseudoalteromonas phenolica TaxID=161398 RepID=UPI00148690BC|nr:LytTR family DNA-binding domain-containing protein [Pseudoalteromonas phenolica]